MPAGIPSWIIVTGGGILVLAGLRDMLRTLFHPASTGVISDLTGSAVWRLFHLVRRVRPSVLDMVGPFALAAVMLMWTLLQTAGFALIYWPFLQTGFHSSSPEPHRSFADALYVSLVTLATLGYGDITPTTGWLRVIAPVQALVGFALLSAGISWILSVYPVLRRRSEFAHRVLVAHQANALHPGGPLSEKLLTGLIETRIDLIQLPITFYFRDGHRETAFPAALAALLRAVEAADCSDPGPRQVEAALQDLLTYLAKSFLHCPADPSRVIELLAQQHGWSEEAARLLGGEPGKGRSR